MQSAAQVLEGLVPISQFNKGQASKIFDRLKDVKQLIVLKNNEPAAVVLSVDEYKRLSDAEVDLLMYQEAMQRLEAADGKPVYTLEESMAEFDITQEDLEAIETPVFE